MGSASHAGKIEFKALYVLTEGLWHNILTGKACEPVETPPVFATKGGSA